MPDFLLRDQAPLTGQEWEALDGAVVQVARRNLVARRFLSIFGPVGAGVQSYASDRFGDATVAQISLFAAEEESRVHVQRRAFVPLPILYQDFTINWRDLEAARRLGVPLDTTGAAIAAAAVAAREDQLILGGYGELQQYGLLNAEGRQQLPLGDWSKPGGGFAAVVSATQALNEANFRQPFTVIVPPTLHAHLNRVFDNTAVLEIDQVRRLVRGGVYVTPALPADVAVVVSPGSENMDLLIAQDLTVAFLETTSMEHHFRVLEVVSPRVKRPGAVVTLGQV
ncbi:MAG: family 1 encapsulin nanocompartment shell protein [Anaerolineae bacterium]|nr:family 1 encapsulin nanocompartment shell protein [Anaerolineae bacterium]